MTLDRLETSKLIVTPKLGERELPVKDDDCFLVFINEERIIYNWRWETIPAKSLETLVPVRFARRIR